MSRARTLAAALHGKVTWLEPEEHAYTASRSQQLRRGRAIFPDGKVRAVYAGIPDTAFSVPAHGRIDGKYVRGFLVRDNNDEIHFNLFTPKEKGKS